MPHAPSDKHEFATNWMTHHSILPDASVEISKARIVEFRFVRIRIPSEKENDDGVIGEAGRLGSRGAERLNEPDTELSLAYGNVTFVKWGPE